MRTIESVEVDEGIDAYGVRKQVFIEQDQIVEKLTFDAEPMLEQAAAERAAPPRQDPPPILRLLPRAR